MRFRFARGLAAVAAAFTASLACAQTAPATAGAGATGGATGQMLSLLAGMVAVLGLIAAAAWLLKRFVPRAHGGGTALRVIAGAAVGPRERVVVVEIGSIWLVVGVAPGSVNALHQMPRATADLAAAAVATPASPFAAWLKQKLEKRGER
jgi:flagellar protein FliO/FliZ